MPATPEKYAHNDPVSTDFVLKHRIVGAAFLLFFSALFLPWLLGPPGEATTGDNAAAALQEPATLTKTQKIEEDLLAAIEQGRIQASVPEQVYISKITPLDANRGNPGGAVQAKANTTVAANTPEKPPAKDAAVAAAISPAAEPVSTPDATEAVVAEDKRPALANDEATTTSADRIDVGWVVQVGVFTDKRGAAKVVEDLKKKGFSPVTSIVDTNRGAATGTRIWLGPFAQRVDAAKAKTQLKNKTGEAGFIRAYP